MFKFLHSHDWYIGHFITGFISKYTGDHVGRSERQCLDCDKTQIYLSQYSKEQRLTLRRLAKLSEKEKYVTYKKGDKIDKLTLSWIKNNR
jgi:hypothetical protein